MNGGFTSIVFKKENNNLPSNNVTYISEDEQGRIWIGSHDEMCIRDRVIVDAPFAMEPIKECVFPEQDFSIVDYGAVKGGETVNTEAIAKAIEACNKAGGGRVVIPDGEWLTGPVHFKSNVNLHLEENAICLLYTS